MHSCLFCQIAAKKLPSYCVYEDKEVYAFLDKHPINPGHILVVPKKHQADFYALDTKSYTALMLAVKKISTKVSQKMNPKKVGLIVAGFDVAHTHVHIVPMKHYHDITSKSLLDGTRSNPTSKQLSLIQKKFM